MEEKLNISILGAGAWGLTLGVLLAEKKHNITLWEISEERSKLLNKKGTVSIPGIEPFKIKIPSSVKVTSKIEETIDKKTNLIILAIPSQFALQTIKKIKKFISEKNKCILISVIKGFQTNTLKRITEAVIEEIPQLKDKVCVLSGPSFAIEVAKKLPTAVVVASKNKNISEFVQKIFFTEYFRVYTHEDIAGVELGGALKNIFAIACGISDGLGFGDNTKSALITRGLKEMVLLGKKLGGEEKTFFGLSGLGDLIATCFSKHSRNRMLGEIIGKGEKPEIALKRIHSTSEGYRTTKAAYFLGKKFNLDLPIINEVYSVIYKNKKPEDAVKSLMLREAKPEFIDK
ncbi:MAG: NAD(P)H-dependent glycerol-3-phosphate dehydrogenase [Endomicrobiia bacterium]